MSEFAQGPSHGEELAWAEGYAKGYREAIEAAAKVVLNSGRGLRGTVTSAELAEAIRALAIPALTRSASERGRASVPPSVIYDAVYEVCQEWRPGMTDEVKDAIACRVRDRVAHKLDTPPGAAP
jgi:hypothetical protein